MLGSEGQTPEVKFETPYYKIIRGDPQWCDQGRFESTFEFNDQKLRVFVILWGGAQECPFKRKDDTSYHGYKYGARDVIVTNITTGKQLCYSTLLPHMIKHHAFFEGPMCVYRIDPAQVIDVIGKLEPGKSYRINSYKRNIWTETSASCVDNEKNLTKTAVLG